MMPVCAGSPTPHVPTAQIYTGKYFMAFMNAYLRSVVHSASELLTFDRFGWTELC